MGLDLSFSGLVFGVLTSAAGLYLIKRGRSEGEVRRSGAGLILMVMSFVTGSDWWAWILAGGVLAFGLRG